MDQQEKIILSYWDVVKKLSSSVSGNISRGRATLTHNSNTPLSLMIHQKNTDENTFDVEYMDMEDNQHISFLLDELDEDASEESLLFHNHNFYEIMIVLQGEIDVVFEGLTYTYHPGDVSIVNREIIHLEKGYGNYKAAFLALLPDFMWSGDVRNIFCDANQVGKETALFFKIDRENELQRKRSYIRYIRRESEKEQFAAEQEIEEFSKDLTERKPGLYFLCYTHLIRLFTILADKKQYQTQRIDMGVAKEQDLVREVCRYLNDRKGPITADALAKTMNYSSNYISGLFRKYLDTSVLQYNREVRLKEAERLLRKSDKSVSEIAYETGYENRSHFYRIFKEKYGMTPMEYRESCHSIF